VPSVVIENPILNSPFDEPTRHFTFGDEGITNEVVEQRRTSSSSSRSHSRTRRAPTRGTPSG